MSYIFGKWNFLALVLRNFQYFRKREPQNGNPKKCLIFQEVTFQAGKNKKIPPPSPPRKKNSYISENRNPEKIFSK